MSLTWTEGPAAHAAQIYAESSELADTVAEYLAAGFETGLPAQGHANPAPVLAPRLPSPR